MPRRVAYKASSLTLRHMTNLSSLRLEPASESCAFSGVGRSRISPIKADFLNRFLSRLESSDRQASIAAVLTLSRVFGVSLASMFETELAMEPCIIVRAAEGVPQAANGLHYTPLSNTHRFFNLQPMHVTISPTRPGMEHYKHDGEEWIYLLSGRLTLSLAGKTYDLEPGDAAHLIPACRIA
jgi:hypothetical protein